MYKFLKILMVGLFLGSTPALAIMNGGPAELTREDISRKRVAVTAESNFIFESDISPDVIDNNQTVKGEWYFAKGTLNINEFLDLYARIGVSHLQMKDITRDIKEQLEWTLAYGGGVTIQLYQYKPLDVTVILDGQYYGTTPGLQSVTIDSITYTLNEQLASSAITGTSYQENNIEVALLSRMKTGIIYPYIGPVFLYKDIKNKFIFKNVEYNLSGDNKNKIGLVAGFDLPFNWAEVASGDSILSVEAKFITELAVSIAFTSRF